MAEFFASIDAEIMGRKTLDAARKMGGSFGSSKIAAYVFSRSQPPGERDGLTFVNQSPETFVAELRDRKGKDIWLMGGGELAREFLKADLVDEIYLGIVPIFVGRRNSSVSCRVPTTGLRATRKQNVFQGINHPQVPASAHKDKKQRDSKIRGQDIGDREQGNSQEQRRFESRVSGFELEENQHSAVSHRQHVKSVDRSRHENQSKTK